MEFDRSQPADWLFVRQTERIRRALRDCGLPVVGLSAGTAPAEAAFGGLEQSNDVVVTVSIRYGTDDGPWAVVDTERFAGTTVATLPLRDLIDRHIRGHGDAASALVWTEGEATVLVDGRPTPARIVRAGERWWAVRCSRDGVTISVAGRDWHPAMVAVDTLADVDGLLDHWQPPPRPPSPPPASTELDGEPHRLLVTAAIETAVRRRRGPAGAGLPPQWSALWKAAVARQAYLADQDEAEAELAVRALVDQLTDLYGGAEWFRDDARRRERAVTESLLYATLLTEEVSSRPAQEAWRTGSRRRWLHEWAVWASST